MEKLGNNHLNSRPRSSGIRRICYVTATGHAKPYNDGSSRYRCFYPAAGLKAQGYYVGVVSLASFMKRVPDADMYVFHRPSYSDDFADIVERLEDDGKLMMADYDDLIFNTKYMRGSSLFKNNFDPMAISDTFNRNLRGLRLFSKISVSTPSLADLVKESVPNSEVIVLRNGFPPDVIELADHVLEQKKLGSHVVGYFPGTRTHDLDFMMWRDPLFRSMEERSVPFLVMGPLDRQLLESYPRVTYVQSGSFHEMILTMRKVSISLAPLEDTTFNRAKSNIKAIESFLTGSYSISTPINDTKILMDQGFDIDIIEKPDQIYDVISARLDGPIISERNARLVREFYAIDTVMSPLYERIGA